MRFSSIAGSIMLVSFELFGQKISTSLEETWKSNAWQNLMLSNYTYTNGYLTSVLNKDWVSTSNSWNPAMRTDYVNNSDSTIAVKTTLLVSGAGSSTNLSRDTYTYTANKWDSTDIAANWVNNAWRNSSRLTYTYINGLASSSLKEEWDTTSQTWVAATRMDFTYNSDSTYATVKISKSASAGFVIQTLGTYTYSTSANKKISSEILASWVNNAWQNTNRVTDTISGGKITNILSEEWVAASKTWKAISLVNYAYNSDGSMSQMTTLINLGAGLINSSRVTYTYLPMAVERSLHSTPGRVALEVAQNSSTGLMRINLATPARIRVADIFGRTVFQASCANKTVEVDMRHYSAGAYLIFADIGITRLTKMIIKP